MEFKVIDINTVVADGITYTTVEHDNCEGCEFITGKCPPILCGNVARPDHRSVIWKRKTTDIQMNIKVVNENKIIIDGVEYQPLEPVKGCAECVFRGEICHKYGKSIPCAGIERKDGRRFIWKKVPDKQIHVSLSEIRQTKKKIYKLNFKP